MLYWFGLSLLWLPILLTVGILALLAQKKLFPRFPFFSTYIAYMVAAGMLKALFLSNWHVYFYVYWLTEPVEIVLSVLAVHESFHRVFEDFYRLRWFPRLFPATIGTALLYSIWKAYVHPPLHVGLRGSIIIALAIAAQYTILGISILFFMMVRFIHVRWRLYEFRIVLGFGIASLIYAFSGVLRSESGTIFDFLSKYLPGMGYVLAVCIWLSAMLSTEPKNGANMGDNHQSQMVDELRSQLRTIKQFLGQG
jgi:hypothetical protein